MLAREEVLRALMTEANSQQRERRQHAAAEIGRMERYYADLRTELAERRAKALAKGEDVKPLLDREAALEREAALRIDELRRKAVVRAQLRLSNLLRLHIPRLFLPLRLVSTDRRDLRSWDLSATWDPLTEQTDALECPHCRRPTFTLTLPRRAPLGCPICTLTSDK